MDKLQLLLYPEAEAYIKALQHFDMTKLGSPRWMQHHEHLEKLNMQAALTASAQEDEFIKDLIVSYDKLPQLIVELITVGIWKRKIFPHLLKLDLDANLLFPIYIVLYHEATVISLLETCLFHRDACEAAEDAILDLEDYCYQKLTRLLSKTEVEAEVEAEDDVKALSSVKAGVVSSVEELQKQDEKLDFDISIKTISILRYLTDHVTSIPLSVVTRMLDTHDWPMLLSALIESPPWSKKQKGKLLKYIDNKWNEISTEQQWKITKLDGQVWIAIYQLLLSPECQRKYTLNSTRKNALLKLRCQLTDVLLDQLPPLVQLKLHLEQLSVVDPPAARSELILEQVPEIQEKILKQYEGKWQELAKVQRETYFNPDKVDFRQQAKSLGDTYSLDLLESLMCDTPKCALCGTEAVKRCSRCQNEWYCRRECQVKHWSKHKPVCDMIADVETKLKLDSSPVSG